MKRKRADTSQKTLEQYMHHPGWQLIHDLYHRAGVMLSFREAGGGGDCMFHSIAAAMNNNLNYLDIRKQAAEAVTPENAPDVLMDMSAQVPASLDSPMDMPKNPDGQFSPEMLWNSSKGSKEAMAEGLRKAIATPGNYLWGDATLAALAEIALNVNIILLAVDAGVKMPPTPKELLFARTIFTRWVERTFEADPDLLAAPKDKVLMFMMSKGLSWERALTLARMGAGFGPGRWLRGKRQPVGTVKEVCRNPQSGNLSNNNYLPSRPTIIIWNRSNVHWVPIGVGPSAETVISPTNPLRPYVDLLMK